MASGCNGVSLDAKVSAPRYFPYGEVRWHSGDLPTNRRFTGQREEVTLGVYDYGARFYSPGLGRFLSADTLVPEAVRLMVTQGRQFQGLQYDRNMIRTYPWMNK